MAIFISGLSTFIKLVITLAFTFASLVAPAQHADITAPCTPLDSENCKLNFSVISDPHVYESGIKGFPNDFLFEAAMIDMKDFDYDAFIITGDITDHGEKTQWEHFETIMSKYDPAEKIILAMGNHDHWTDENDENRTAKGLFIEYNKKITGRLENMYYSEKVNGYTFIVITSEKDDVNAYFSNKQINWLKGELNKASKDGKPIFVISHWPINKTHGLPVSWGDEEYDEMTGGMGDQSAKIKKLLNKYENVILLTGHIHNGFSNDETAAELNYISVQKVGNFYSVNLPAFHGIAENGEFNPGAGYSVEVYDDEIVFRARNFFTELWQPQYNYTITLK